MNCKFCNTENLDEAVFCKQCGKRIDGKIICPKCKTANSDENSYCISCGTRIDGKTVCSNCGTVYDGQFCPICGFSTKGKKKVSSSEMDRRPEGWQEESKDEPRKWQKIVSLVGGVLAMLTVFFSVLFTFLIGFSTNELGALIDFNELGIFSDNIYYYFGKGYEIAETTLNNALTYSDYYPFGLYLPVIFGTIIAAGTLITVLVLTSLTLARFVRNLTGKTEKGCSFLAAATFFTFLAGAASLYLLNYISVRLTMSLESTVANSTANVKISFNDATVAGIVLGASFLCCSLGCGIAKYGKRLISKEVLLPVCISVGALIPFIITFILAANPVLSLKISNLYKVRFSYSLILQAVSSDLSFATDSGLVFTLSLIGIVLQSGLLIVLAFALASHIDDAICGSFSSDLGFAITIFLLSLLNMIFSILIGKQIREIESDANYVIPIVTFVFALFGLAVSIVKTVFQHIREAEEE